MKDKITKFLKENGAIQVGFCRALENPFDMPYAISFVVPLSDAIIDTIDNAPTHTYFHHYRSVNTLIDNISLRCGLMLRSNGYKYVPIPASQSVSGTHGIYSHKSAAVASGLGTIGKSALFLSYENGPRVRLGTILTDCEFEVTKHTPLDLCGSCELCKNACPAMAILGNKWTKNSERSDIIDAQACSDYMKRAFQKTGRGAVCGICMRVCPMKGYDKNAKQQS